MGWKGGAAAGAALGASLGGPVGAVAGAIVGGALLKEGKKVCIKNNGLHFKNGLFVPWNYISEWIYDTSLDVVEDAMEENDDDTEWARLKNGIELRWHQADRDIDDLWEDVQNYASARSKQSFFDCCDAVKRIDTASQADECLSVAGNCLSLLKLAGSMFAIKDGDVTIAIRDVPKEIYDFALGIESLYRAIPDGVCEEVEQRFDDWVALHWQEFEGLVRYWAKWFSDYGDLPTEEDKFIAADLAGALLYMRSHTEHICGDAWDCRLANMVSVIQSGEADLLPVIARLECIEAISHPGKAKSRKVIVCTDRAWRISSLFGDFPDEVQIFIASDLEKHNENIRSEHDEDRLDFWLSRQDENGCAIPKEEAALRARKARQRRIAEQLYVFDEGHPRNGCAYLQSPVDCNRYYEINDYHSGMMRDKSEELRRLLCGLGAFSYTVEQSYQHDRSERSSEQLEVAGSLGYREKIFSANGKCERTRSQSNSLFARYRISEKLTPVEVPKIPEGLSFFPHDSGWQDLASKVLSRAVRDAEIEFECKEATSIKKSGLDEINAKLKFALVDFSIDVSRRFEREEEELRTRSIKYQVTFVDELGRAATEYLSDATDITRIKESFTESERRFYRMIRKYATDKNISLDPEQVRTWAQSYGITSERAYEIMDTLNG